MYVTTLFWIKQNNVLWLFNVGTVYIDQHIRLTIFTDHWIVQWKTERNGILFTWNHNTEDAITYSFFYNIKINHVHFTIQTIMPEKQF